ncbi:hypothetical protein LTR85_004462 [Meristemomyces frigidus]|nr:hypothetical protein LTR85_004462 [Meristemomyces frigidus]
MPGIVGGDGTVYCDDSTFRVPPSIKKIQEGKKMVAQGEKEWEDDCNGCGGGFETMVKKPEPETEKK